MIDYENFPRDQALNMIVAIYKSGMRLFRLIENYLMYAQLELAMLDKERIEALRRAKPLNLERTVSAAAMQAAQGQDRSADLKLDIAQIEVRIAHDSLTKIVAELVDNSCKFSEPGTLVEVSAAPNGNIWQLIVRDHGRGIEPDQIRDIGAYMQFERALYEQQGMGLGLIISRRLAELHGGRLDIESEVNVGTVVTVTLPHEAA
jgi:signal transduction histidine kinase